MDGVLQHPFFKPLLLTVLIIGLFPLVAAYLVLLERKVLADLQVRLGPMRVGPHGLLQPLADAVKLLAKEDTIPAAADKAIFWFAPIITTFTALTSFALLPFSQYIYVVDVNVGLLVIAAMSAVGILGIILGGWASNSHYSLLGSLRSAAQLVSYEVALALALICGVMMAGSLSMVEIVEAQQARGLWFAFGNYGLMFVPFMIYFIASIAETNRAPFDLPEAESELVAGFHTEYSGLRWGLFYLGEYANILVVAGVAVTLFWGGWLRPFPNVAWLEWPFNFAFPVLAFAASAALCFYLTPRQPIGWQKAVLAAVGVFLLAAAGIFAVPALNQKLIGLFWFVLKVLIFVYLMIWFRGTFPRFRYDQLMNLGWKILIPLGMASILVNAGVAMLLA